MSKSCNRCGLVKPLDAFHRDKRNRDGRQGQCKPCRNAVVAAWQERNPDRVRAASNRWKERNPERVRAYSKKYWRENAELEKARREAWMTRNPGVDAYYSRLRRDRKRGAQGDCSFSQLQARWDFYGGRCWMCGTAADTIDHVIPLARGGSEWPSNLRPACRSCNSSKGASWPLDISGLN